VSGTPATVSDPGDTFWWGNGQMEIKARAKETGGALGVIEGRFFEKGYGPPLHVHSHEDEAIYLLEGKIRFRIGDDEFVAHPGTWVWQPRGVPQAFRLESERARVLVVFTPGGIERMFEDGGVPVGESSEPPEQQAGPQDAATFEQRYGFKVVGPQLE
jgi:quercetin dioxygenase-like cupin family protein